MNGVQLGARFSLVTNRLKYCGPEDAEATLYRAIVEGKDLEAAGRALLRFEALEPYLAAIAAKHGLDPLDHDVVEAYWIGNGLLDDFTRADFARILEGLGRRGLPLPIVRRLTENLPDRPIPHHAFHVAFVGVGAVTGHVPTILANMEACRPGWARIVRMAGDHMMLENTPLTFHENRFALGVPEVARYPYDPHLLPDLAPGDAIALHWRLPVTVLSAAQLAQLRHYSIQAFTIASDAIAPLRAR